MLVLLFAVALTLLALLLAGVVIAIVTGVALVNVLALIVGLRARRPEVDQPIADRWRPRSFGAPPEPYDEPDGTDRPDEPARSLTIHRR